MYLASLSIEQVSLLIEAKRGEALAVYLLLGLITNIFNFIGQLLLCKILFQFGQPGPVNNHVSSQSNESSNDMSINSDIAAEREAEQKARIWN